MATWQTSTRTAALMLLLGLMATWLAPGAARALDMRITDDGFGVVDVPVISGADSLWIDVEAPGLAPDEVTLMVGSERIATRATPFGVGAIVSAGDDVTEVAVGLTVEADVNVAIAVVDADGRILHSDAVRHRLEPITGDVTPPPTSEPPTSEPPATDPPTTVSPTTDPPTSNAPVATPPVTTARPTSSTGVRPPVPSRPGVRPRLPRTGADPLETATAEGGRA